VPLNPLFGKQREKSGSITLDKYDYQYNWALSELLRDVEAGLATVAFVELHDDVVFADSTDVDCVKFIFCQVKNTKGSAWTRQKLLAINRGKTSSILGKLVGGASIGSFAERVTKLRLIATAGFKLKLRDDAVSLQTLDFINTSKPGPLSFDERLGKAEAYLKGEETFKRRGPVGLLDLKKFAKGLKEFWARGRQSLRQTWRLIKRLFYAKRSKWRIPTFRMFMHHAPGIIVRDNLKAVRQGLVLTAQYDKATPGQSSDMTFGVIEIVDIDGWMPKVGVAIKVKGKIVKATIKVVFAVSRLTGAVLGWEFALKGENGESFRRCIASIFLPKQRRASALGLGVLKGLLHGNIDAVYVDNGAGASESVVAATVDKMGLIRELAPPSQGQKKGRIESLNAALIRMMAEDNLGATRDTDALAKEMRRLYQKKGKAIPLDDLERYILRAFNYHNLCHDVSNLRTEEMRKADIDIYPADLHRYTQLQRFGDARKVYTEEEVNDRFLPWVQRECRKGIVYFRGARWTSRGLIDYFNEGAKSPGKTKSRSVWLKALTGFQRVLMWRRTDGAKERLEMVSEDARKYGSASWTKMDVYEFDDQYRRMKMAKKTPSLRAQMSNQEHQQQVEAQQRIGNPLAGAIGSTVSAAKDAAALKRDQEIGRAEAASYNMQTPDVKSDGTEVVVQVPNPLDQANEDFYKKEGLLDS